jgi:hypothetical protein
MARRMMIAVLAALAVSMSIVPASPPTGKTIVLGSFKQPPPPPEPGG